MDGTRRAPILPVVALAGAAALVLLLPAASGPTRWTEAHFALEGLFAGGSLAVAVLALSRHRDTGEPHPLFVAVGFALLAIHTLVFGIGLPLGGSSVAAETALASHAAQVAWLVAGVSFMLASRRVRPPVREATLALAALVVAASLDLLLLLANQGLNEIRDETLLAEGAFALTSPLHWILMVAALVPLVVAAWGEHAAEPSPHSPHPWLSAAFVVAAAGVVLAAARPTASRPLVQPADLLPPLAAALAFVGYVSASRARASALRSESEVAREVTSGRAEIASMISHELKNPIMSIKGLASTGSRMYESMTDDERREFFQMIDEESTRLKGLVEETATALKVDAGTLTYDMRAEDLGRLVEETAWAAARSDHPLVVETEPDLVLECDRLRLAEVVEHVIGNAAKFSPPDSPIQVRAYRAGGDAVVEVSDRGPGIPREQREAVFRKFAQYRPPGYEEVPGSGLGLFICRAHVARHGGDISVEDAPGSGTMLRVTLPGAR